MEAVDAQERGVEVPHGYCIVWMGDSTPCGSSGISAKAGFDIMAVASDTEGGASAPRTGEVSAVALEVPVASLAGERV